MKKSVCLLLGFALFFVGCGKDKSLLIPAQFLATSSPELATKYQLTADTMYPATIHWKTISDHKGPLFYILRAEVTELVTTKGDVSKKAVLTCEVVIPAATMPVKHGRIKGTSKIVEMSKFINPCSSKNNMAMTGVITVLGEAVPDPRSNATNFQLSEFVIEAWLGDVAQDLVIGKFVAGLSYEKLTPDPSKDGTEDNSDGQHSSPSDEEKRFSI